MLQVLALVKNSIFNTVHLAQQALVVLVSGQNVDNAPEARPSTKTAQLHVGGDQAGCDADVHGNRLKNTLATKPYPVGSIPAAVVICIVTRSPDSNT